MKTVAVLFSYLAICLPLTYGQTFCLNGVIPCAANAVCGGPSGDCVCSTNFKGDGRVQCAPSASRCVCTARGDPLFTVTDGQTPSTSDTFTANLPCKVTMFASVSDPSAACQILSVTLVPEVRTISTSTGPVYRTFADALEVSVFQNDGVNPSFLTFTLTETGVTPGSALVGVSTAGGFAVATLSFPACGSATFGFNATYGAAFANLPKTFIYPAAQVPRTICGNCDGLSDSLGTTPEASLLMALRAIAPVARQAGIQYATQCTNLANTVTACPAASLQAASTICGPYLGTFGQCLKTGGMPLDTIMTKFTICVNNVCNSASATACTIRTADGNSVSPTCSVPGACP